MLAKAVYQSKHISTDTTPSRASPLPHDVFLTFFSHSALYIRRASNMQMIPIDLQLLRTFLVNTVDGAGKNQKKQEHASHDFPYPFVS
ncbi:hypothetical protein FX983_03242 [Pseudomonas frederiksbergensis]|uniref:Uncharacterized protein n=1 Tax=Pseudomonas frederiksbergensis TaxID=104087 RepID=A0A6L5C3S8_9PSED|nr:hypothetical protein FX983_03242 [Pseudomonas frederiksbergensis]